MVLHMAKKRKLAEFTHCKVTLTTHPKAPWRVSYPVEIDGMTRRKRRMFSTEEKALNFATDHERDVSDFGVRFGAITGEARRALLLEYLEIHGKPPHAVLGVAIGASAHDIQTAYEGKMGRFSQQAFAGIDLAEDTPKLLAVRSAYQRARKLLTDSKVKKALKNEFAMERRKLEDGDDE